MASLKKRTVALLCVITLLCLAAGPAALADEWDKNVIFLALNDSTVPLTDSAMPIRVGGTIYVPYFTFDANQNGGVRLGVFNGGQNKTENTLTLYDANAKNLTFDLRTGTSYDYYPDGEKQTPTAVIRNGQIYLSASATASYFGLTCVQSNMVFGEKSYPYVRIRNADAALSDLRFKESATNAFLVQLQNYYRSVTAQTHPDSGAETPPPNQTPPPGTGQQGVRVYLAVRMDTGEAGELILNALAQEGKSALILFAPEQLAQQDDLVRRALGEGHTIGLVTAATQAEQARLELEEGNRLLAQIAHTTACIVLAEQAAVADRLAADGWLCWRQTVDARPGERSTGSAFSALLRNLEAQERPAWITLDDSTAAAGVLTQLLRTLRGGGYQYRPVLETIF